MVDYHRQQIRNRRVAGGDETTYAEIARWACVIGVFVGLLLGYAWIQMEILHLNYEIEQIRKENNQLEELNSALRAEQSSLLNPEKIDRQARELGLIHSSRAEVRVLKAEALPGRPSPNLVAEVNPTRKALHE